MGSKKLYERGPPMPAKEAGFGQKMDAALRNSSIGKAIGLSPPKESTNAAPIGYSGGKARARVRKSSGQEDGGLGG